MLPDRVFQILSDKNTSENTQSIVARFTARLPIYMALIGAFVTGAVGLLGVSAIANDEIVTYIFAGTLGVIYIAQDGSTLVNRGRSLIQHVGQLNRDVLRNNASLISREAISIGLSLFFILLFDFDSDVADGSGFSRFSLSVRSLLLFCICHAMFSSVVDCGAACLPVRMFFRSDRDEHLPLLAEVELPLTVNLRFSVMTQLKPLVSLVVRLIEFKRKGLDVIAVIPQLNKLLKSARWQELDVDSLQTIQYYLCGALFWYQQGEKDKGDKKIKKVFGLLEVRNIIDYPNNKRAISSQATNEDYLNILSAYYEVGSGFWKKMRPAGVEKKELKLSTLAALKVTLSD